MTTTTKTMDNDVIITANGVESLTKISLKKKAQERARYLRQKQIDEQYQKRQKEEMHRLQSRIEQGRSVCPHCSNFHILEQNFGGQIIPSQVEAQLFVVYGNNPQLHDHIYKYHPQVIETLYQSSEIKRQYLTKVKSKKFFEDRIKYAAPGGTDREFQLLAMDFGSDPRYEVERLQSEMEQIESQYPALIKAVKKEYLLQEAEEERKNNEYKQQFSKNRKSSSKSKKKHNSF